MILPDVNVLVYAHRRDAVDHATYRKWVEDLLNDERAFGISEFVLSSFTRIVTHPQIFKPASTLEEALSFAHDLLDHPNCVLMHPGPRHWGIFENLCRAVNATGNLIPDAYLAALAIESGSEWITTDHDYRRFPGLKWRHPLE